MTCKPNCHLRKYGSVYLALAYVLMIPIFACIYSHVFADAFYAPYRFREPDWEALVDTTTPIFEAALQRSSKEQADRRVELSQANINALVSGTIQDRDRLDLMKLNALIIDHVKFRDGRFNFGVFWVAEAQPDAGYRGQKGSYSAYSFLSAQLISNGDPGGRVYTEKTDLNSSQPHDGVLLLTLRATNALQITLENPLLRSIAPEQKMLQGRLAYLTPDETVALKSIVDQADGISNGIGADFWRMLYFSAVVATTLGLGDILPITSWARAAVGLEAFFGVVLAGAFLAALTAKASE